MAEVQQDFVYNKNLQALQRCMGVIYNNAKFSDTVFTVKQNKFYALSHLVAVSSTTLDSIISNHNLACNDRCININNVKYEESFSVILQYVYGLELNFTQMNTAVMCEVLNLSETYCLREFSEDLKSFIAKIDKFNIDSLVALLNTAKKFNMTELYEKLSMFAHDQADEFVKLESFVDLQYDVLLDLLRSDQFFTSETNILKGVLLWHRNKVEDEVAMKSIAVNLCESNGSECNESNGSEITHVQSCSETVLKSLLCHIRAFRILAFEYNEALLSELFVKYKDYVTSQKLFSGTSKPRIKTGQNTTLSMSGDSSSTSEEVKNNTETLAVNTRENSGILTNQGSHTSEATESKTVSSVTVKVLKPPRICNIMAEFKVTHPWNKRGVEICEQEYLIGDLKWKLSAEFFVYSLFGKHTFVKIYLECTSDKLKDWECIADCEVKTDLSSPSKTSLKFSSHHPLVPAGQFGTMDEESYHEWYGRKPKNQPFYFEVHFKTIEIKGQ